MNRNQLKLLAILLMTGNHVAVVFLPEGILRYLLEGTGYFTAITMCYFLVEGYQYTHSKKQYGIRLAGTALLSEIPFLYAFRGRAVEMNMIFTLFLCFLILVVQEKYENQEEKRLGLTALLTLGTLWSDWAVLAPAFTLLFWRQRKEKRPLWEAYLPAEILFFLVELGTYGGNILPAGLAMTGPLLSWLLIGKGYNGEIGIRRKGQTAVRASQWFFYLYYPLHLLLIGGLRSWLG